MYKFKSKVKTYLDRIKAFKKASFVLENGKYNIIGNCFSLISLNKGKYKTRLEIKSNKKYSHLIKQGTFMITPYKYLFMNDEIVFSFVRGRRRFCNIQNNLNLYYDKLSYKAMECKFDNDRELIISNCVKGVQYSDDEHLWIFIDYYLRTINSEFIETNLVNMSGDDTTVMYYPQHGDCHTRNIFWKNDIPTFIDLDDIDSYPLFYDIFYYAIALKHEDAFSFFRTKDFENKIYKYCEKNIFDCNIDVIDFYLGAYVYFWVNKMKRKMKYHEIHFYLKWFENVDLSSYPIVLCAMNKYYANLKKMRIKNEKR